MREKTALKSKNTDVFNECHETMLLKMLLFCVIKQILIKGRVKSGLS